MLANFEVPRETSEGPKRLRLPFFYPPLTYLAKEYATRHRAILGETDDLTAATAMVDLHRNIDCPRYDACLETAAKARWLGFSCRECPRFKE